MTSPDGETIRGGDTIQGGTLYIRKKVLTGDTIQRGTLFKGGH